MLFTFQIKCKLNDIKNKNFQELTIIVVTSFTTSIIEEVTVMDIYTKIDTERRWISFNSYILYFH